MPRSTLSTEEQVSELNKRASEANQRIIHRKVTLCLKQRPDLAVPCREKLMSLGIPEKDLLDPAKSTTLHDGTCSKQLKAMMSKKRKPAPATDEQIGSPARAQPVTDPWPAGRHQVQLLTPTLLKRHILSALAPGAWFVPNLQKANLSKEKMLELFEFATGLGADFELKGDYTSIGTCVKHFTDAHAQRQQRGVHLVLPVSWPASGLYNVEGMTEHPASGLVIAAQFMDKKILLPFDMAPPFDTIADLSISHNFSELRATLASKKDAQRSKSVQLSPEFYKVTGSEMDVQASPEQPDKKRKTPDSGKFRRALTFEGETSASSTIPPRNLFADPSAGDEVQPVVHATPGKGDDGTSIAPAVAATAPPPGDAIDELAFQVPTEPFE
eukprot:1692501-Amphidinium_carterae.1